MAYTISSSVFLFFVFSVLIYWLFGFKYWVISVEVPRFLNGSTTDNVLFSEITYARINIAGVLTILMVAFIAAYYRWHLSVTTAFKSPDDQTNQLYRQIMISYSAIVVLAFLAALFLGDALRRLRSQI